MHPFVKLRLSSYAELFKAKSMWIATAAWGVVGTFSLIKSELLPQYQAWTVIEMMGRLSFRTWAWVLLVLIIGILLEGGHAAIVKRERLIEIDRTSIASLSADLQRALANPTGPEIVIRQDQPNSLTLVNAGKGTAHQVDIREMTNGHYRCKGRHISHIAEGKEFMYYVEIELINSHAVFATGDRLERFLMAGDEGKTVEEKKLSAHLPFHISYWDGGDKDYFCEYEMFYNRITQQFTVTRTKPPLVKLRPGPSQ